MQKLSTFLTVLSVTMVLAFFGASTALAGTTYYVSPSGENCATGCGTEAKPWKTLQWATEKISTEGNTVKLAAGNYKEKVTLEHNDISVLTGAGSNTDLEGVSIGSKTTVSSMSTCVTVRSGSVETKREQLTPDCPTELIGPEWPEEGIDSEYKTEDQTSGSFVKFAGC